MTSEATESTNALISKMLSSFGGGGRAPPRPHRARCRADCQRGVDAVYGACAGGKCFEADREARAAFELRWGAPPPAGLSCALGGHGYNATAAAEAERAEARRRPSLLPSPLPGPAVAPRSLSVS
jgi:hypothetical protein